MKSVYDTIMKVRATSSKNDKIAILTKQKGNADLREFLRVTYEPRINFYMSKIDPKFASTNALRTTFSTDSIVDIIAKLNGRSLTGHDAKMYIANMSKGFANDWERELLTMLIERDVKAGFSESTINKVWADTVTDIPYMRCSLPKDVKLDSFPWSRGVYSQIKADGMFANITHNDDGTIRIESRNGSPFPLDELSELVADAKANILSGYQVHGELLVARKRISDLEILPRQEGNGMLNKVLKGGELPLDCVVLYDAWDLIPAAKATTKGKWALKYEERFKNLTEMLGMQAYSGNAFCRIIETKIVYSFKEAQAHYQQALARGLEGTIIKHPDMEWKDGTSKHQVKMKLEFAVELRVVGYNEGKNKYAGMLGSLQCESEDGKLKVNVAGFTDKQRKEIWETKNMDIVTVKSNSIMPPENKDNYSLFLPIFVEERLDKKKADTLARIIEQFEESVK